MMRMIVGDDDDEWAVMMFFVDLHVIRIPI